MKTAVITGSTRGIGYGLAEAFLDLGCQVVVSGRTAEAVELAVGDLAAKYGPGRILGQPCDVCVFDQVQALWDASMERFGAIDIWVNNAGVGNPVMGFWELVPELIESVITTNVIGVMYGSKVALAGMVEQGHGALYNMEGLGSTGRKIDGLTLYGTTKAALRYLDEALAREVKEKGITVGALRPGMVVTDFLLCQFEGRPDDLERAKPMFNILCDKVETVTPWLAERVLANNKNGAVISWQSTWKMLGRFLTAPFSRRNLFD